MWSAKLVLTLSRFQALARVPTTLLSMVAEYCEPRMIIFGGASDRGRSTAVWLRTVGGTNWTQLAEMPTVRIHPAAAVIGDSVYFSGGLELAGMDCYSLLSNTWSATDLPRMNHPRTGAAAVSIANQMLVFGGQYTRTLDDGEKFDPVTKRWLPLRAWTPRYLPCATEWQGRAFVFGGSNSSYHTSNALSSAACYDPVNGVWHNIRSMKVPRIQATAVAVPGRGVLVMGGWRDEVVMEFQVDYIHHTSCELYDPIKNTWTTMPWHLPKPLSGFIAHCLDGVLYILGGASSNVTSSSECFSMDLDAAVPVWLPLRPLPTQLDSMFSLLV